MKGVIRPPKPETCKLLGPVSLVIQLLMGILVVLVLLLKRNYEHPRRKMIVWCYDISKQLGGSLGIHFLNLGLSVIKRKHKSNHALMNLLGFTNGGNNNDVDDDQCDWYFLNLLLDTTIGIPILWVALHGLESLLHHFNIENVQSGNYFPKKSPNKEGKKPMFSAFLKQLALFITGLAFMKFWIFVILNYFEDVAYKFAELILGWSDPWPNFQVFLIMFVCPILLNCFQYCCVDNIIKLHRLQRNNIENFEPETMLDLDVDVDSTNSSTETRHSPQPHKFININATTKYGSIV